MGAGYIAVEIAGILSALGSKTSLMIRHDKVSPSSCLLSLILVFSLLEENFFLFKKTRDRLVFNF